MFARICWHKSELIADIDSMGASCGQSVPRKAPASDASTRWKFSVSVIRPVSTAMMMLSEYSTSSTMAALQGGKRKGIIDGEIHIHHLPSRTTVPYDGSI